MPKEWEMRQFGFVLALVQTNTFLVFNHFRAKNGLAELSKAEFVRELCREMIENAVYRQAKADSEDKEEEVSGKRRKRVEEHELCKIPAGFGKWNGTYFRPMK